MGEVGGGGGERQGESRGEKDLDGVVVGVEGESGAKAVSIEAPDGGRDVACRF